MNWKQGEWKTDVWLLILMLGIAFFFVGGHTCTGR